MGEGVAHFYPYARDGYKEPDRDDWIVLGLYFLAGALSFALSTGYHMISNHSHAVNEVYHRLDKRGHWYRHSRVLATVNVVHFPLRRQRDENLLDQCAFAQVRMKLMLDIF